MESKSLKSLVLIAAVSALAVLMAMVQLPWQSHLAQSLQGSTHIIVAGLIAMLILHLLKNINAIGRSRTKAFVLTMAITVAAESAQSITGRPFEGSDILLNLAGVVAVLLWVTPSSPVKKTIASLVLLIALTPTLFWLSAYAGRAKAFPKLIECGSSWSSKFLTTDYATIEFTQNPFADNANTVCKVTLFTAGYPGIAIDEPVADWADHDFLVVSFDNPDDKALALTLRIHDARHNQDYGDRYNLGFELPPGASELRIALDEIKAAPASRKMNMHRVTGILIFATNPKQARIFYIGDMKLVIDNGEAMLND